ncbi:helix-turn-helix domain-containing protein [Streptomyces venezuelae]|uniref:GbsR/MarR family transcriptional regulator n=1 Tax=Streptomyces venezuelae TaxID=54571 RepID=UPI00364742C8
MGGGRLTADDRRAIEAGLSDALSYAAIARRLGRATSSVSREVARNGGPDAYRAEHADRADTWRRRNRLPPQRPTAPAPTPPDADTTGEATHGPDPAAVHAYVDEFAALLIAVGLPRTAARVVACLVTTPTGAATSAELTRRLKVSPASVSKAVGYLEGLAVLTREHEPGRRRDHYVIDEEVWLRAWLTSANKNAACAATALEGADLFGPDTPTGARLVAMHAFFAGIHRSMTGPPTSAAIEDALTILAALFHAARPLTTSELAAGLGWPTSRVITAVQAAGHDPGVRLTPEQRAALAGPARPPEEGYVASRRFSRPASS